MKKTLLCISFLLTISMLLCSCAQYAPAVKVEKSANNDIVEVHSKSSWAYYNSLEDLIKNMDYVIIGKISKVLPVERLSVHELAITNFDTWWNVSPVKVEVEKVIKGEIKQGDTITLKQPGGKYTGLTENKKIETINEIVEGIVYLEEGSEYLMFVFGADGKNMGLKYYLGLASPAVGFAKIVYGKVKVNKDNYLYSDGTSIEDMEKLIKEKAEKLKQNK